ncbi:hypothetical protein N7512_005619 [Penicillium capsulatum]|nr:hypothetical protein N7512_005619 [Penicillium capsulatum]
MQPIDIAPELPDLTPLNGDGWNDHLEIFTGAQTWAAIYYLHGNIADVRTDLLWDAEFSFVNALETSLDTDVEVRASRVYLESAQRWMQLCGKQIYDLCRGRSTSSRPNWSNASGIIDRREKWLRTEGHVLEKSRWDYWKNRFAMLVDCSI